MVPGPGGGTHPTLVLYKYDACPFCRKVQRRLDTLPFAVAQRDTRLDPTARAELQAQTGRTQVPCLFIDGVPLFESDDIIAWLEAHAAAQP